jgi:two-component system sensor histidine kinase AtoS
VTPSRLRPRFLSLRAQFLWGTVVVIALVMAVLIGIVDQRQRTAIIDEVQRRGAVLARNLAAISSGPLLLYHYTALEQNVAYLAEDPDVTYAIILDAEGRIAANSLDAGVVGTLPADPASRRAAAATEPLAQEVVVGGEPHGDFAFPIVIDGQRWGTVRVGLSKRRLEGQLAGTRRELALVAAAVLVFGGLAAALMARRIARPVRQLADGAAAIARGELDQRIEPATSDEIGRLALAFNHMAEQLAGQRRALGAAHAELGRRFTELSDLKSYTDHILGSLTSGIVTVDLEGRVVTLNATAESFLGSGLAVVRGRPAREVFAHVPDLAQVVAETLASRAGTLVFATIPVGAPRTALPVEVTTAPLRGADGHDLGVVVVLRDLSAERALEEQLRRSDRLAAIGTLAAGLAHEIKNPLTSVLTFTRHLSRRFDDERFRQRFQSVVPRELERINGIVEDLLRLARPTRLAPKPVAVPALLDQAVELYANQIDAKRIAVVREYAPEVPRVLADQAHLYQALVNLVANALEAMDEGGTLGLRVGLADGVDLERGERGPVPHPLARSRDRRLRVEVRDTGAGIAPSASASVFNPFFTTKPTGTGLGLAIAHKIVEDHGGSISFTSAPGQGTTFVVLLPLVAERLGERRGDVPRVGAPRIG